MMKGGFVAPWGSGSVWDRSTSYSQPAGWMPHYLFRLYASARSQDAKTTVPQTAFFAVYLTPEHCQEPCSVWGVIVGPDAVSLEFLDEVLFPEEGPPFLTSPSVSEWKSVPDLPAQIRSIVCRASPLVDLTSNAEVERSVVGPLIQRFNESTTRG